MRASARPYQIPIGLLSDGGSVGPFTAGQVAAGSFAPQGVLPIPGSTNVTRVYALQRIYCPFIVAVIVAASNPVPTEANIAVNITIGGQLVWTTQQQVALSTNAAAVTAGWGNGVIAEDFVNPLVLEGGRQLTLSYSQSYNQAVNNGFLFLGASLSSAIPPATQTAPGLITGVSYDAATYWS